MYGSNSNSNNTSPNNNNPSNSINIKSISERRKKGKHAFITEYRRIVWERIIWPLVIESKKEFIDKISSQVMPTPPNYRQIILINRGDIPILDSSQLDEIEMGPNRCSISGVA